MKGESWDDTITDAVIQAGGLHAAENHLMGPELLVPVESLVIDDGPLSLTGDAR